MHRLDIKNQNSLLLKMFLEVEGLEFLNAAEDDRKRDVRCFYSGYKFM